MASEPLEAPGKAEAVAVTHPHPLQDLTEAEFAKARDAIAGIYAAETSIHFRCVSLREPRKDELIPYLLAEHDKTLSDETPRPPRLAAVQYDVIKSHNEQFYTESLVDVESGEVVDTQTLATGQQAYYTL